MKNVQKYIYICTDEGRLNERANWEASQHDEEEIEEAIAFH